MALRVGLVEPAASRELLWSSQWGRRSVLCTPHLQEGIHSLRSGLVWLHLRRHLTWPQLRHLLQLLILCFFTDRLLPDLPVQAFLRSLRFWT
jgi:hypothetical protein